MHAARDDTRFHAVVKEQFNEQSNTVAPATVITEFAARLLCRQ